MIQQVFRTSSIIKTRTVKKIKRKRENVLVSPEKYFCGRCQQEYLPGENEMEPDKCPNCVCVDCGRSLMNRPRHHTQCGKCWGMGTLGKDYKFEHKHEDAVYKMGYVYVEEEVEEPYSINETKLQVIPDIPFSSEYPIVQKEFSLDGLLNLELSNDELEDRANWFGVHTFQEVIHLFEKKSEIKILDTSDLIEPSSNEVIVNEKQVLEEFDDVVGFYPNVPAFIMGYPLDMYNNTRRNVKEISRQVSIWFNVAIDSKYSKEAYKYRGIAAYNIAEYLVSKGINVTFRVLDCSFIAGEVLYLFSDVVFNDESKIVLYKLLTEISFERVLLGEYKKNLISQNVINSDWENGMGFEMNDSDIKQILNLDEYDILINNLEDLNVQGRRIAKDFLEVAKHIGLYS